MRILLADDDRAMCDLLEAVLAALGHKVETTMDGAAAWAAYQADPAPLVVLDWEMPGLDGLEVCRRIRAHPEGERSYVLMVTARSGSAHLEEVLDAGADDYLAKPVSPDDLSARLRIAERRMELGARRREAEAELREARYLAGIGELSISLQHEINNPLTAVLTTVQLLNAGMFEPEELPASLQTIEKEARRIAELLRKLREAKTHRSVEYVHGKRMVDLGSNGGERIG